MSNLVLLIAAFIFAVFGRTVNGDATTTYTPPPGGQNFCTYTFQCAEGFKCSGIKCEPGSKKKHIPNKQCTFSSECPEDYNCDNFTCFYGGKGSRPDKGGHDEAGKCHSQDDCKKDEKCIGQTCQKRIACTFDHNCPKDMYCSVTLCHTGAKVIHLEGVWCNTTSTCEEKSKGYVCDPKTETCYKGCSPYGKGGSKCNAPGSITVSHWIILALGIFYFAKWRW